MKLLGNKNEVLVQLLTWLVVQFFIDEDDSNVNDA